ncbi:FAD binding domain-containing protein [Frigidibacter sp. SD6-1]|uniref:FAD binding domain-containing protein n=1 Tax=Frigidibacter sp. SD6-1 TaxID=3032581 RepID=UPI0024E02A4E|nr:FAD binding domain-containing protein [Frigidibacter sp. SD6-1]
MYDFTYLRPRSVDEAVAALRDGFDARPLAGGMTLLPTMKARLSSPGTLVDLSGIAALKGIEVADDRIEVGAMTRHADVAGDDRVRRTIPALSELAGSIGDRQVRNRGTMGGALSNADPSADYPAAALALDARLTTSTRTVGVEDFFLGTFTTCLEEDELLCRIGFRIPRAAAYVKVCNPSSGYAMTGVFIARFDAGYRVAVTGAASRYFRHTALEAALDAGADAAAALKIDPPQQEYLSDLHAPGQYRRNLVRVVGARAVERLHATQAETPHPNDAD